MSLAGRSPSRIRVKMEQLADKMVVIYFDSILKMNKKCLRSLTHAYKDLPPEHKFEVVFVDTNEFDPALISDQHEQGGFGNELPNLPWNAIPLSDVKSKRRLKKIFRRGRVRMGTFVVINSAGVIMHWEAIDIFCRYGAAGYPFTRKKIDELKSEDDKDAKTPSLNALLASHKRDYLISNKGEKVPIRTLEDKVVALFFYTGCQLHHDFTAKLKVAYEELRVKHQDFEVVLIYLYDLDYNERVMSEETFSETFKTMPWLALPYGDSSYYKLKRLFFLQWHESEDYGLIVIGPRMEFIQPFGISMLEKFKSPAYPFSYERVAELVAEKAKELELKMLWHPDGVFGGKYRSEEVKLDGFVNKNVIVLYDCYGIPHHHAEKIIYKLKERYHELMGTSDEFEVIDITSDSATYEYVKDLPWDVVHLDHDYTDEPNLFGLPGTYTRIPSLFAFDRNGRMVRKTMFPTFEDTKFPFYSGSMDKEVLSQLTEVLEWDQFQYITGSIYTYKKNSD
ncbi:hypothetical protein OROGR_027317 [Orobanche gracilis]